MVKSKLLDNKRIFQRVQIVEILNTELLLSLIWLSVSAQLKESRKLGKSDEDIRYKPILTHIILKCLCLCLQQRQRVI